MSLQIDSSKSSAGSSKKLSLSCFCILVNNMSSSSFGLAGRMLPKLCPLLWENSLRDLLGDGEGGISVVFLVSQTARRYALFF
jgi:hypothetical protein